MRPQDAIDSVALDLQMLAVLHFAVKGAGREIRKASAGNVSLIPHAHRVGFLHPDLLIAYGDSRWL